MRISRDETVLTQRARWHLESSTARDNKALLSTDINHLRQTISHQPLSTCKKRHVLDGAFRARWVGRLTLSWKASHQCGWSGRHGRRSRGCQLTLILSIVMLHLGHTARHTDTHTDTDLCNTCSKSLIEPKTQTDTHTQTQTHTCVTLAENPWLKPKTQTDTSAQTDTHIHTHTYRHTFV